MEIKSYDLLLDINFQTLDYEGKERIRIENPDGSLALDTVGHSFNGISVNGAPLPAASIQHDPEMGALVLKDLPRGGSVEVSIDFVGRVNDKTIHGFYKSNYDSGYLLATDFEPASARRLFPCVDNPSFRAEVSLSVIVDEDLSAISNMPIAAIESVGKTAGGMRSKKKLVRFERTPKMSTYLIFLGVGRFDEHSLGDGHAAGPVEIIGAASPGKAAKTHYGLENGAKFLKAYRDYYSIAYPLRKLHLIALPEYAAGAMENWGAITFRENALLIDENSSVSNKRRVATVVGHEVAHQWFGDLVTMKWWNDLWLNESFATFLENKMTDKLYPDWRIFDDFLLFDAGGALAGDSLRNTHPIDVKVASPEEVSGIFDEISYGKGASILRMIEAYLGEEPFRRGVGRYLEHFKYSNAEGNDLWRSIQEASGQPVERIMSAWIKSEGYPVVDVGLGDGRLELNQSRFFLLAADGGGKEDNRPWPIPLTASVNGTMKRILMDQDHASIPIDGEPKELKLNVHQTGFYRVRYSQELYQVVERGFEKLSYADRYGVLDDLFAFVLSGREGLEPYLRFVRKSLGDTSYLVVDALTGELKLLHNLAPESPAIRNAYGEFLRRQMERLGVVAREAESDHDKLLRAAIAQSLALFDEGFASRLAANFPEYKTLDPNMRPATAIAYAVTEGEAGFGPLVTLAKSMGSDTEQVRVLNALASFRQGELVGRALDLSVSGEFNRANCLYAISSAAANPLARADTWKWFLRNFGTVREIFSGTSYSGNVAESVIPGSGLGREEEVREYFSAPGHVPQEAERGIRKGLELLEIYSRARARLLAT
jgi:tricorn protease interacting factor F2/3